MPCRVEGRGRQCKTLQDGARSGTSFLVSLRGRWPLRRRLKAFESLQYIQKAANRILTAIAPENSALSIPFGRSPETCHEVRQKKSDKLSMTMRFRSVRHEPA
jgi:hypothetical protein